MEEIQNIIFIRRITMDEERTTDVAEIEDEEDREVEETDSMTTGTAMLIGGLLTAAAFVIGCKVKKAIKKAKKRKELGEKEYYDRTHVDDEDDEDSDEDEE